MLVITLDNCLLALKSGLLISWTSHCARPALLVVAVGAAASAVATVCC